MQQTNNTHSAMQVLTEAELAAVAGGAQMDGGDEGKPSNGFCL